MTGGGGQDDVEKVRLVSDIVDIIGSYVNLRQTGKDYSASCPFHKDKSPSFHVSPDRQLWHCFSCKGGGDVFSFIMQHEGLSFPEALEMLAQKAGITLQGRSARQGNQGADRSQLIAALKAAVRFYRTKLAEKCGDEAREYLLGRGIPDELLTSYYIGYAPPGNILLSHASKKIATEVLVQTGLTGLGDGGRLYDRFRDRIVIPILSPMGEPLGFGARGMRADVQPKYLNSPETAVYKKAGILFGIPQARPAIKADGFVLVVEGYFDVLSLATAGICNAVAPCGTALTPQHVKILLRYTKKITLLFDGDQAGDAAAWRALDAVLPVHPDVSIVMLPSGKDPDDMIREGNLDTLSALISAPLSPIPFASESLDRQGVTGHERVSRIAALISKVGNLIARELMLDAAAGMTRVPVRVLREEVDRLNQVPENRRYQERNTEDPAQAPSPAPTQPLSPMEKAILHLVQISPETALRLREATPGVPSVRPEMRDLLSWIVDRVQAGHPPAAPELLRRLTTELGQGVDIGFLLAVEEDEAENSASFRDELLGRLQEMALEHQNESLGYEIRALDGHKDQDSKRIELMKRKQEVAGDLARLRGQHGQI